MNFLNMPKIIMFLADGVVGNKGNEYRYIDIFRAGNSEADYPEDWLWSIRKFIINGRKKYKGNNDVLKKYNWLQTQFNNYASELDDAAVYECMGMSVAELYIH